MNAEQKLSSPKYTPQVHLYFQAFDPNICSHTSQSYWSHGKSLYQNLFCPTNYLIMLSGRELIFRELLYNVMCPVFFDVIRDLFRSLDSSSLYKCVPLWWFLFINFRIELGFLKHTITSATLFLCTQHPDMLWSDFIWYAIWYQKYT